MVLPLGRGVRAVGAAWAESFHKEHRGTKDGMARSLVIVESPAKAKTINKYLGRNYTVKASFGHVMDLPKKSIGILLPGQENGKKKRKGKGKSKGKAAEKKPAKPIVVTAENIFEPTYEVIPTKY